MMRKFVLLFVLFAGVMLCADQSAAPAAAAASVQTPVPAQTAVQKDSDPGIIFCLARGLCNMTTGWLELPRCMVYDNGFIPVFGLLIGIPEGAGFTVFRTLCGVYDTVCFGTSGKSCHGKIFPDTVFQSKWKCRQ